MILKTMRITFPDNRIDQSQAAKIRGYIASSFPQYIELHHHLKKDRLLYQYPHIQYKVLSQIPMVIGIENGVEVLKSIYDKVDDLKLGNDTQMIFEKQIEVKSEKFDVSNISKGYVFLTPWLALNQKNYKEWWALTKKNRQEKLRRTLIGNILSMAKGLEYVVTEEIKAEVDVKPITTTLKGVSMMGFLGEFQVNFQIPDYLGIGKSVSTGFGTVVRVQS